MARVLEALWRGEVLSPAASRAMVDVLRMQQLNNKMPFRLLLDYAVAHKTGEDDGISHDVGIVYAAQPFVACFLGSDIDAPRWNTVIGEITQALCRRCGGLVAG